MEWLIFSSINLTAPLCLLTMAGVPTVVTAKTNFLMSIPRSSKHYLNTSTLSSPFVVSVIGFKQQSSSLTVESQYLATTAKHGMSFTS